MGEVGDQYRRAIRAIADPPVQPWFLTGHEREKPLQPLVV